MAVLKGLNMALAFALELAMLAALAVWGYGASDAGWVKWALALGAPALVAGLWGLWLAPKAARRLPLLPGVGLSLGLFLLSAAALYAAHQPAWAIVLAAAAGVNRALVLAWRQW